MGIWLSNVIHFRQVWYIHLHPMCPLLTILFYLNIVKIYKQSFRFYCMLLNILWGMKMFSVIGYVGGRGGVVIWWWLPTWIVILIFDLICLTVMNKGLFINYVIHISLCETHPTHSTQLFQYNTIVGLTTTSVEW